MDLSNLIPDRSQEWIIKSNLLQFKKLVNIPCCHIQSGVVYVFLDARIHKQILKLTNHLIKSGYKFYFTTPKASNPSGVENLASEIIRHYFISYANLEFYRGFKKMNFDLIKNMVDFTEETDSFHLVKDIYEKVNKEVQRNWYDYYAGKDMWYYSQEIREIFNSLWRDIQISKIL
jgi:hypothetical protein